MTRYLYRVAFGITTSGNIRKKIETIKHVVFQTNPPGYIGLDAQIKIFEDEAFEILKKKNFCLFREQVMYIASEAIPCLPQTIEMKADVEITFS